MLLIYLIAIECGQIHNEGVKDYLNFWNTCDLFQLISTLYIVVEHLILTDDETNKENERTVASLTVLIAWVKVFDWLRLFDETAFYMKLMRQTFIDMTSFVLIYFVGLAMVGSSMYIMQMNVVGTADQD